MPERKDVGTSITINDLDLVTLQRLESEARRLGVDVATLAREMLRQAVPTTAAPTPEAHHDLDALAGTWSAADAAAFEAAVSDFERVDGELWSESDPARVSVAGLLDPSPRAR